MPEQGKQPADTGLVALVMLARYHHVAADAAQLADCALPALATLHSGETVILAKVADDKVLIQSPLSSAPTVMSQADFRRRGLVTCC